MLEPLQMRAPSKRWLALASILFVSTATLAWTFTRLRRPADVEGAPAFKQKAAGSRQKADLKDRTSVRDQPISPTCPSCPVAPLVDSDNDGIPDIEELRTYQDRDSFRRWFTAIAENQFYQLSDQWSDDQRDCAGLARFAMREALRHHDRIWFQKMGPAYQTVAPDVKSFDLDHNSLGE